LDCINSAELSEVTGVGETMPSRMMRDPVTTTSVRSSVVGESSAAEAEEAPMIAAATAADTRQVDRVAKGLLEGIMCSPKAVLIKGDCGQKLMRTAAFATCVQIAAPEHRCSLFWAEFYVRPPLLIMLGGSRCLSLGGSRWPSKLKLHFLPISAFMTENSA
jgi:hypothetical protein